MTSGVARNYDYLGTCCQGDAKIYVIVVVVVRGIAAHGLAGHRGWIEEDNVPSPAEGRSF